MLHEEYFHLFKSQRVMVIGDIMLDVYHNGIAERISPEAPVPVVRVNETKYSLGGAANVAQNVAALGAEVVMLGVIGNDLHGDLINNLFHDNVKSAAVRLPNYSTITKVRAMCGGQQIVRMDFEEHCDNTGDLLYVLSNIVETELLNTDVVIISDYNKGLITTQFSSIVISTCRRRKIPVIVDPKGQNWTKYLYANIVTPNVSELSEVLKIKVQNTNDEIIKYGEYIKDKYVIDELIVTRSHLGVTRLGIDIVEHMTTDAREVFDVCGAGDTVIATAMLAHAAGANYFESASLANYAAGVVVGKVGTATCSPEELLSYIE